MITIEAVNSDLDKIAEKNPSEVLTVGSVVAIVKVVMKFLSTMRSNQLLTEQDKVDLKKAKNDKKK